MSSHKRSAASTTGRAVTFALFSLILVSLPLIPPLLNSVAANHHSYEITAAGGSQQTAQVETQFTHPLEARIRNLAGEWVGGIPVTFTAPASGASGTFATTGTNTVTVTSSSVEPVGWITAPAFTANDIEGSYSVQVSAPEAFPNFFFLANSAGTPDKAATISTGDGGLQASQINTPFSTNFSVTVFDGSQNFVPGVEVVFTAPSEGPSGTFAGTSTNTATATTGSTGVATAPQFTANSEPGDYSVTASVSGDQTVTGNPIWTAFSARNTLNDPVGVPNTVSTSAGGFQHAPVLTAYATNLQVAVFDGNTNHVSGATVVFTAPESGPSGTFADGSRTFTTTTGTDGLATASTFTSNDIVGQVTVHVAATKNDVTAETNIVLSNGMVDTTTTLTKDPTGDSVYGQPVELTATLEAVDSPYVPTGPVTFYMGDIEIGSCDGVTPNNGVAVCTLEFLEVDNYLFSAEYFGDESSRESESSTLSHNVNRASTTVELISSEPDFIIVGDSVTFTATVSVTDPGAGVPSGDVVFTASDGTELNGGEAVPLQDGQASVTTSALLPGQPIISANYVGSSRYLGSDTSISQNVYSAPEVTTHPESQVVLAGQTAMFTASANGVPVPDVQWQVSSDGGQTFEDIDGEANTTLSFSPSVADDQNQYRAVFTNELDSATTNPATLTVREAPAITSDDATTFVVGETGLFEFTASGYLPPTISVTGDLPVGVEFDEASASIGGVPEPGTGGIYSLTITASNDVEPDAEQSFTLTVNEAPSITSNDGTTFVAGSENNFQVVAEGFPEPTFSVTGELPPGVTLDSSSGELSGNPGPGTGGIWEVTLIASNEIDPDSHQSFSLTVHEAPQITSADSATFIAGQEGSFQVTASGVPEPALGVSDELPGGISFDPQSGMLSGSPEPGSGGIYTLTITASNGVEPDAQQSFTLTINEAPSITSADSTTFVIEEAESFTFSAIGFPEPVISLSGTLPSGITFLDGVISGIATETGEFDLTVTASNGVEPDAHQQFTLNISKAEQEPLFVHVNPDSGVTQDRIELSTSGGSGEGEISYDVGDSNACVLGVGDDAGKVIITSGVGTCVVTATKAEDWQFFSTTSEPVSVAVERADATISADSATGTFSGAVTLFATLEPNGTALDGKSITFNFNGFEVGSAITGDNGVASLQTTIPGSFDAGFHPSAIEAVFNGDDGYNPTNAFSDLTVEKAPPSVSIANLPPTPMAGNNFTPVFDYLGDGSPSVQSLTPSVCSISSGIVYFDAPGTCELLPSITEGTNYLGADGEVQTLQVGSPSASATTIQLWSSSNPAAENQPVIITARVQEQSSGFFGGLFGSTGGSTPQGSVTFLLNGEIFAVVGLNSNGQATATFDSLALGNHVIEAVYGGSVDHQGVSGSIVQQVKQGATVELTSQIVNTRFTSTVVFTALVSPPEATGIVDFYIAGRRVASSTLVNGAATYTSSSTRGGYTVVAIYRGDAKFVSAESEPYHFGNGGSIRNR